MRMTQERLSGLKSMPMASDTVNPYEAAAEKT